MNIKVSFVGTQKGIESKVVPREGFELKTILSAGLLGKKRLGRWMSWVKLPIGTAQSRGSGRRTKARAAPAALRLAGNTAGRSSASSHRI